MEEPDPHFSTTRWQKTVLEVSCARCQALLWLEATPPVEHFLCGVCEAITFYPKPGLIPKSQKLLHSGLSSCPMCGAAVTTEKHRCEECGEQLSTQPPDREFTVGEPVARTTNVTPSTIGWFAGGSLILAIFHWLLGLSLMALGQSSGTRDALAMMIIGILLLVIGMCILTRQIWALTLAMGVSLAVCGTLVFLEVWVHFSYTTISLSEELGVFPTILLFLFMLALTAFVGFVRSKGVLLLREGFSPFVNTADLPVGWKRSTEKSSSQPLGNSLH